MKTSTFFILALVLATSAFAQQVFPNVYFGLVTIDGSNATNGTIVEAIVNGTVNSTTSTPSIPNQANGSYYLSVIATDGTPVELRVFGILADTRIWDSNLSTNPNPPQINLNVNKSSLNAPCTYNAGCASNACCSGTCLTTCTPAISGGGGGGGGGGGVSRLSSSSAVTPTTPPAPTFNLPPTRPPTNPPVNNPPSFLGNTGANTNTQAESPEPETGLTPQATGLFSIGGRSVSTQQAIIGALVLFGLLGAGFYAWKGK